jgi:hypothetical protein
MASIGLAVMALAVLAAVILRSGHRDQAVAADREQIGMGCGAATVDGSPVAFEQQQQFLRSHAVTHIYRASGMFWVVYPSTGGSDLGFAKPEASWVPDSSAEAERTCAVYLSAPTPRASS